MHERAQLGAVDDLAVGVEGLIVDLAHDAELTQALDADAVGFGQRAEPRRVLGDEADAGEGDVDRLRRLEDRADLGITQQAPALALDLAQREQVLHGQRVRLHVRPVLGRHHPDQRVGEEVDQLERALARQGIEGEVAEATLAQRADRLVEREPTRQADAHAVAGDLLEVGGGRRAQLGLDVAAAPETITTASRRPNFWATAASSCSVRGRSSSTRTNPSSKARLSRRETVAPTPPGPWRCPSGCGPDGSRAPGTAR